MSKKNSREAKAARREERGKQRQRQAADLAALPVPSAVVPAPSDPGTDPGPCPSCGGDWNEEGPCSGCGRSSVTCHGWNEDEDGPAPDGQHGEPVHYARDSNGVLVTATGHHTECPYCD